MSTALIITGASRGIGAALAKLAFAAGHSVIGLSRQATQQGIHLPTDLTDLDSLSERMRQALAFPDVASATRVVLINNAGTLAPVGSRYDADAVQAHFATNLMAPILLGRAFIDALAERAIAKRIIQITSGAATTPFRGWSLYGAGKAALDQYSRTLALEQADQRWPVDILSISPGVVDTAMQAHIRDSTETTFPDVQRFRDLANSSQLADPTEVAHIILAAACAERRYEGSVLRREQLP